MAESSIQKTEEEQQLLGAFDTPSSSETLGEPSSSSSSSSETPAPVWLQFLLVGIFFVVNTALPFYNKHLFHLVIATYPTNPRPATEILTPTIIMLMGASVFLVLLRLLLLLLRSCCRRWCACCCGGCCCRGQEPPSVLFGPAYSPRRGFLGFLTRHFGVFFRNWSYLVVPGLLFAAVMALTNTSLSLTSVNLHVLLRSTLIVWVVVGAWLVEGERPSIITAIACAVVTAGAIMASYKAGVSYSGQAPAAITLTVLSAAASGWLLVFTRRAARVLGIKASIELAAFKTSFAALVLLPLGGGLDPHGWSKLSLLPADVVGLLVGGIFVTLLFQLMLVLMQSVTLATSAGVISLFVIIPQLVIKWIESPYSLNGVQIAGYVLAPLGVTVYAIEHLVMDYRRRRRANKYQEA